MHIKEQTHILSNFLSIFIFVCMNLYLTYRLTQKLTILLHNVSIIQIRPLFLFLFLFHSFILWFSHKHTHTNTTRRESTKTNQSFILHQQNFVAAFSLNKTIFFSRKTRTHSHTLTYTHIHTHTHTYTHSHTHTFTHT